MPKIDKVAGLVKDINKHFKKPVLISGKDMPVTDRVFIGVPMVDYVLGGGLPINRFIEFYGSPSSGKSYCMYKAIAAFQHYDWENRIEWGIQGVLWKQKTQKVDGMEYTVAEPVKITATKKNARLKRCVLIDYENSFDAEWGAKLGIDVEGLLIVVPDKGSEAVDVIETVLQNEDISLVCIDSIHVIGADAEIENSMEKEQMGVNARFWNKAVRKIQAAINANTEKDVTLIGVNRAYDKIGIVYGNPSQIGGGKGLSFGKHVSVEFSNLKVQKGEGELKDTAVGRIVKVRNEKNKTARPYLSGEFYFTFIDEGLYTAGETDAINQYMDLGLVSGVVSRTGNSYQWNDKKVLGRDKFMSWLYKSGMLHDFENEIKIALYAKK